MTQQAQQLPQAQVLSYISAINTPTRVRKTASIAAVILGVLFTIAGAIGTFYLGARIYDYFSFWFAPPPAFIGPGGPPPRPPLSEMLSDLATLIFRIYPLETLLFVPLLAAPILLFTARGICRGRPVASNVARAYLVVPFFQIATMAAIFNGYALVMTMPMHGVSEPEYLVRLISFPFFLLPALLIVDLRNFLKWIARNPHAEKTPTPFLPARDSGTFVNHQAGGSNERVP